MTTRRAVLVVLLAAPAACGTWRSPASRISGTVSADGIPVPHARVLLLEEERWIEADDAGRYDLRGIRPALHTVAALAAECQVAVGVIDVSTPAHVRVDLLLERWSPGSFAARFTAVSDAEWTEGAATRTFTAEQLRRRRGTVLDFLAREAPDVVQVVSGQAGASGVVRGRAATLRGESQLPLIIVDGVTLAGPAAAGAGANALRDIALADVRRIDIVRAAAAAALYGSLGAAGAIRITTTGAAAPHVVVPAGLCPGAERIRR